MGGIQKNDPRGIFFREVEIALADSGEKLLALAFDAVEFPVAFVHAAEGCLTVEVEHQGDIWQASADGEGIDPRGVLSGNAAGDALVDRSRIKETVTDHDAASFERGLDFFPNELGAARGEEKKFGFGNEVFALGGVLEEVADRLSSGSATGFAYQKRFAAGLAEFFGE